jgi:hypothetical protein
MKHIGFKHQKESKQNSITYYTPRKEVVGRHTGFTMSVRLSVRL